MNNETNTPAASAAALGSPWCQVCKHWSPYLSDEGDGECTVDGKAVRRWDWETCDKGEIR